MTSTTDPVAPEHRPPHAGTRAPRLAEVPAFTEAMRHGWADAAPEVDVEPGAAAAAAAHRARLGERLRAASAAAGGGDPVVVVAAGTAPVRNDDCSYAFRADSDFVWLTGVNLEGAVLVQRGAGESLEAVLFAPPPFRPGETGFFTDALHGELWVGPAAGPAELTRALGITTRPLGELDDHLQRWRDPSGRSTARLAGRRVEAAVVTRHGLDASGVLAAACSELRLVKDAWEVAQLRGAVDATVQGFVATVAEVPAAVRGGGERWLQGTFDRWARTTGNGPGYASIVGSGPHAPTLHWVRCDGQVLPDAALLLDLGVEARSLHTADVTRTVPPSGTFSATQRAVHELVTKAHLAGMDRIRPGTDHLDFHFAAMEVVARGLSDWGLLDVSVDEALSPQGQQHRRWLVCGIGHHLGLDVHDCSSSSWEASTGSPLEPGVVMTVEPGLYFHARDTSVPPELRGVGVRLEDDLLVTETGHEVLSGALPVEVDEVEAWTRRVLAGELQPRLPGA